MLGRGGRRHPNDRVGVDSMTTPTHAQCSVGHARDRTTAEEGRIMHVATKTKVWTLEELHSLPDDGNKYELVRGELFVTPPPNDDHETILARLSRILDPYVEANDLGLIYRPRSVVRFKGSEVEPDLMVRRPAPGIKNAWQRAPRPILIVEVFSPTTRRRDGDQKKKLYLEVGIDEYWMVDPEQRVVTIVRPGHTHRVVSDLLTWSPAGTNAAFAITLDKVFA
jgi:Uma2 family endonuclease